MYLHLGADKVVRSKDIIGIFDMDTSTVSKRTREFLTLSEKNGEAITVSFELPKSFVVVSNKKKKEKRVYISQISSSTLYKRNLLKNIYL